MTEPGRILIVDDDAAIRSMLSAVIKRDGFDVENAKDGQEAIDVLAVQSFDLILLDVMMPRIDGFGVVEYLEHASPGICRKCVVMLTAASESHFKGFDETLVCKIVRKPFGLDELRATVRECLHGADQVAAT